MPPRELDSRTPASDRETPPPDPETPCLDPKPPHLDPKTLRVETSRKLLHLSTALIPLGYLALDEWFTLTAGPGRIVLLSVLAAAAAIAVAVELLRHRSKTGASWFRRYFGHMVRDAEWTRLSGATYVLIAALLTIWIFPKPIAVAVLLILSVSDSAASLVGLRFGRARFLGKSVAGSSAFFLTALAILWVTLPNQHLVAVLAAALATVVEALPALRLGWLELNDNLMIPLLTGAAIWFLKTSPTTAEIAALF